MNFIQRVFGRNRYLSENYTPNFQSWEIGQKDPIIVNPDKVEDIYHKSIHLKTVINNIAELVSFGIWKVVDEDGKELEGQQVIELLNNPNPLQSGEEFKTSLSINEDVWSNAYIYKNLIYQSIESGLPKQLWIMKSDWINVVPTGKFYKQTKIEGIIKHYEFDNGIVQDTFKPKEIIRFKQSGIELLVEPSKIKTLHPQIVNLLASYDARKVLISERGAIGFISADNTKGNQVPMSPKEKENLEKQYQKNYGIKKNQRRINFSTAPLKYTPTNFKTKDLLLFEEVDDDYNAIIDAYGYNKNLLSKEKGATFENVKESLKLVMQSTVIPRGNKYANTIGNDLKVNAEGKKLILDYSHLPIMQENRKEQAEVMNLNTDSFEKLMRTEVIEASDKEIKQFLLSLLKS